MKVFVLRYYFAHDAEDFTKSVHMTYKGVLLEQCCYLLEVLLDMDWDEESERELGRIDQAFHPDDPITVGELTQHINVLEHFADNVELYSEIERFDLQP